MVLPFVIYFFYCFLGQGTPALSQSGIAADVLLKSTITRLATEDINSPEKCREESSAKGHVIYEGKSGHIVSYDCEYDNGLLPFFHMIEHCIQK